MTEDILRADRSEVPRRKRLLAVTNPNKTFITASPESTVSSDSSSDRLPNLSDCHGCDVRVNCTNSRERLQLLDSMWRIVLLCKVCTKRVNSSELCSYCFAAVDDEEECFKCGECQHSIHKECVARCGSVLGLSVCVDCWIPDAFVNSVRARNRKRKVGTLRECRVSVGEFNEDNLVEKEVERKVAAAVKATENAVRKAVAAKNAVELAKGVLSVVASRKVAGGCETEVVDDAELAFLLRRAINSSPRISRYACLGSSFRRDDVSIACYSRRHAGKKIGLMDSSTLDVPLICYSKRQGNGCFKNLVSVNVQLMCYSRRRSRSKACSHDSVCECFNCKISERTGQQVCTSSADLKACNRGSDLENSFNGNNLQQNDVGRITMKPHRYLLKYQRVGKGTPRPLFFVKDPDCPYINLANLCTEGMTGTRNFGNGYECHEICEKFDDNANRFLLKYRRNLRSKPNHLMESTTLSDARPGSSSQGEL